MGPMRPVDGSDSPTSSIDSYEDSPSSSRDLISQTKYEPTSPNHFQTSLKKNYSKVFSDTFMEPSTSQTSSPPIQMITTFKKEPSPSYFPEFLEFEQQVTALKNGITFKQEPDTNQYFDHQLVENGQILRNCIVCGYKCPHKNYGVYCCNACAAFFRRTIKQARSYVCVRGKKCKVDFGGHKRTCRYCRFKRCVMAGMSIDYVLTRADELLLETATDNESIKNLTTWFGSAFVDRFRMIGKTYTCGSEGLMRLTRGEGTLNNTIHSMYAEFDVMLHYFKSSGLARYTKNLTEMMHLGENLFYQWIFVQCVFNTMRHGGHRHDTIYMSDDTCVPLKKDFHSRYIAAMAGLNNVEVITNAHYDLHTLGMNDVWRFHNASIDGTDFAILNHLMCLKSIRDMYPSDTEVRTEINQLFKAIERHYRACYKDFAVRFGNLIMLMNESEAFTMKFKEWVVLMKLSGVKSALEQILASWEINNYYNPHKKQA